MQLQEAVNRLNDPDARIYTTGYRGNDFQGNRSLHIEVLPVGEKYNLYIQDWQLPFDFYLRASAKPIDNGLYLGTFYLRTRSDEPYPFLVNGRHPDLRASQFMAEFIEHASDIGKPIVACRGHWWPSSDNARLFWQMYESASENKKEAALNTWSAQRFAELGYVLHDDEDVRIFKYIELDPRRDAFKEINVVAALFVKPEHRQAVLPFREDILNFTVDNL